MAVLPGPRQWLPLSGVLFDLYPSWLEQTLSCRPALFLYQWERFFVLSCAPSNEILQPGSNLFRVKTETQPGVNVFLVRSTSGGSLERSCLSSVNSALQIVAKRSLITLDVDRRRAGTCPIART